MANGQIQIWGQQYSVPIGSVNVGPYFVPCSPIAEFYPVGVTGSTVTVPVPSAGTTIPFGVIITPLGVTSMSWSMSASAAASMVAGSSQQPSLFSFSATPPTNIFVIASGPTGAYVQVEFF